MKELISIIIPFYNDSETIGRAITSAVQHSRVNTEILVVNDGSEKSEGEKLQEIAAGFEQVRIIDRPVNRGAGFARNTGIAHSKGSLICFLDADDQMYPDKLKFQQEAMAKFGADAVLSDYDVISENDGAVTETVEYSWYGDTGTKLDTAFALRCGIQLVGMLFKREVLEKSGGFRTMYNGQDKDLFIRTAIQAANWVYQQGKAGARHTRKDSISSNELKVLKRNCRRNIMLLAAHELRKKGMLGENEAQIMAEKIAIEARRWAHYGQWEMANLRWKQAREIWPNPKIHGTKRYRLLVRIFGFYGAERIRQLFR